MPTRTMRRIRDGEVPYDGGTAVQEDPGKPVFRGNGAYDYECVECGNVLAKAMDPSTWERGSASAAGAAGPSMSRRRYRWR
jgi:hypothetical protein